ncbi:DotU/TssL family secretion system protein [Paraburkholderia sp. J67]|uniref:DotU/TssL family secretion system protein n=1 Tax=Paraburkholderia sp. J67 TaxID=2805435 RepID=UPI002ABE836B|nr:DotU/TssL family secretion system protein [Paraburkholderia sp. J67]
MRSTAKPDTSDNTFGIPLSYGERLQAAAAAQHPMLEAARPLLQALRTTPAQLRPDDVLTRRQWLLNEAKMFERLCTGLKLPHADADSARYCLCSALDEAAMQTEWGKGETTGAEWSANGLATTLGYDRQGADRVVNLIDSAMRHPTAKGELLAVLQQIIAGGFKGRYRRSPDGARMLKAMSRNLEQAVARAQDGPRTTDSAGQKRKGANAMPSAAEDASDTVFETPRTARSEAGTSRRRPAEDDDVDDVAFRMGPSARGTTTSPRTRIGQEKPDRKDRKRNVLGALTLTLLTALLGFGGYTLYALRTNEADQASSLDTIAAQIRNQIVQQSSGNAISISENGDHTRLAIRIDGMFAPGQYALNQAATLPVTQVGTAIAATPANVLVHLTGYTDDTPFEKTGGLSNQALSTLRAQSVMQVLASAGVSPERITVSGNGDASPLDDNQTREGRARNRRVEITLEQWR